MWPNPQFEEILNGKPHFLCSACILDTYSFCIDLTFTSQPNLVIESGVHTALHQNCHQKFIYTKFDLQFFYPPP